MRQCHMQKTAVLPKSNNWEWNSAQLADYENISFLEETVQGDTLKLINIGGIR